MTTTTELPELTHPAPVGAPRRRLRGMRLLAVLMVMAATGGATAAGARWHHQAADLRADRTEAAAAEGAAVAAGRLLLGLDQSSGRKTLARLKAAATGEFAQQVDLLADTVSGVLEAGKVQSRGNVAASGVEKLSGDTATVLLAATALVSNTELPKGELRTFRMVAHLTKVGKAWKVSAMEFLS